MRLKSIPKLLRPPILLPSAIAVLLPLISYAQIPYGVDTYTSALWHLDETSGTEFADATGLNNGSAFGQAAIVPGRFGNARYFRGTGLGDYLMVPDSPTLRDLTAITIEAWVRPGPFPYYRESIVQKGDAHFPYDLYLLGLLGNSDGTFRFEFAFINQNQLIEFPNPISPASYQPDQCYYVAGTYDGNVGRLYVNGELIAESAATPGLAVTNTDPLFLDNDTYLGGIYQNGLISGIIDEVRISNTARSTAEILATYRRATSFIKIFPIPGHTSDNVEIISVIDHSGTPLDASPNNPYPITWYGKNCRVEAYNREAGDMLPNCPPAGYSQPGGVAFDLNQHYVGSTCDRAQRVKTCDGHGTIPLPDLPPEAFLNYDGHPGYDFRPNPQDYRILAASAGTLRIPAQDHVNNPGQCPRTPWEMFHTFYIDHHNGYSTWYLHAADLSPSVRSQITANGEADVSAGDFVAIVGNVSNTCSGLTVGTHLHFEVRKYIANTDPALTGEIVDPYTELLW